MVDEAQAYPPNYGQAEQVFLMRPDLVLAGTFTAQGTVDAAARPGGDGGAAAAGRPRWPM